ncbi:tol-pal system-associated acyl-CoA thioesterase [Chromatium okenii]|jgi:acyl-CoA thioester hydrolase|uniref:Tol-pal system-associated acyl-CoA thioesterase n=1 Tax=Chromatium okenii TaxID=61644 RepID=A0A2S7XPP8_9GAMM|nr:tol-pal system-associated acyl-CoA thioesterase [Chromatium okenii]MBV5309396.1 tol-pal system-associated acyl-CoA thioesterase [Chromatium okenii]PQJ95714.1 tol-pal system-associated acyl-CoA thioesterase [Chromatium okenii]
MSNSDFNSTLDWPVRIYYEDTDAAGVVFYANYLRFMERGRTEWLRALGYEQDALRQVEGMLFTARRINLDYLSPARFNDLLMVRTHLTHLGGASLTFTQDVRRDADGILCCRGVTNVACVDAISLRPRRLPTTLATGLKCC